MVSALGHNVPRVFTIVFAGGSLLAGLAGVIAGNYFTTESAWQTRWDRSCSSW